ncbi:hypothetical protein OH77DRAFT_1525784 [Trametes cingulata]|nr:hypothetical protein OH77DRAFT_1525784 [Trametes cingulata]
MSQQSSVSKQYSEAEHKAHSASTTTVADSDPNATAVRSSTPPGQKGQASSSAPVEGDTPRQDRAEPRHGHPSLTAIRKRLALLMMPDILEGPLADWMQAYMPNCIDEKKLDHIISALKKEGLVVDDNGTLRWRDLRDKPSVLLKAKTANQQSARGKKDGSATTATASSSIGATAPAQAPAENKTERRIFRSLGTVMNAVAKVHLPNLSASCTYEEEPYATDSEVSGSQHRIDGFLRLTKSMSPRAPKRSKAPTSDVAASFEYKCEEKPDNITDNRWKALYSAFHTLHSDCQRKHMYSVTVEDNHVSLWHFSRSHSAKSHAFDLLDVRTVVHVLATLIFSTLEDLGYDGNIRRISELDKEAKENRIRYVYRLDDRFFKTLKCRDEYDDLYIAGRATRVWEVVEVASFTDVAALPNAQHMILRDVWLEDGSDTEREIQRKIFERCDALGRDFPSEHDVRLTGVDDATRTLLRQRLEDRSYKQLFLTIEADYRGAVSKPLAKGFTPAPHIFDEPVYRLQEAKQHGSDPQRGLTSLHHSVPDPTVPQAQTGVSREYKQRQRNFVVYQEVCSALHELDDLYDVVQALLDALLALQILFLVSWIHRDVSSGNILSFKGRGKLSDLEYAKEFNLSVHGRSADPKTGTPIFMAVELLSRETIYKEGPSLHLRDMGQLRASARPPLAIRHNFQHDLESIFWILAWLVLTHIPGQDLAATSDELFHSKNPRFYIAREHFLIDHNSCAGRLRSLSEDLPAHITGGLLLLRHYLYTHYVARKNSIGDVSTYSPIYGRFRKTLEEMALFIPRGRVRLQRPPPPKVAERSGYFPRTHSLEEKANAPEDKVLSPHKIESLKRARRASDADNVGDQSRAEKRPAHERLGECILVLSRAVKPSSQGGRLQGLSNRAPEGTYPLVVHHPDREHDQARREAPNFRGSGMRTKAA